VQVTLAHKENGWVLFEPVPPEGFEPFEHTLRLPSGRSGAKLCERLHEGVGLPYLLWISVYTGMCCSHRRRMPMVECTACVGAW
jgi:hypothetical protein